VTFAREKRLLLGVLALLVAIPLPFNEVLEWPALVAFAAAVAAALRRAWFGSERWLSNRQLNALGLAYLPLLALDFATVGRIHLVRPVIHLTLFGIAAKLWSLTRERDKWQTMIGMFFVFLAAMATSVNPTILLYLVAFLALTLLLMVRFVYLHILASFGHRDLAPPALPLARFLAGALAATLVLTVPLFALLPRVKSPFIFAAGGAGPQGGSSTGFSDEMSLDVIGRIRGNREIAMRLAYSATPRDAGSARFKATTYEIYEGRSWRRSAGRNAVPRSPGADGFLLDPRARPVAAVEVDLEPLRSTSLVLPVESRAVKIELPALVLDDGGAVTLQGVPAEPLQYRVELGSRPRSLAREPAPEGASPALDTSGLSPRFAALAARWAGEGTAAERAQRIESHLQRDFEYSLDYVGRTGKQPLEDFLFTTHRGHCEYFASAMVLLLRTQGIPARLVTGFLGAEYSLWDRAYVVRQSNAHAWVEAWVGGEGWRTFDPTPADGRPQIEPQSVWLYTRQAWELVVFRWDRYVLSYDFNDQVNVFSGLARAWSQLMQNWFARARVEAEPAPAGETAAAAAPAPAAEAPFWTRRDWAIGAAGTAAVALVAAAVWLWRRRSAWSATAGYRELRLALAGAGFAVPESLAPLALLRSATRRYPAVAPAIDRLVAAYLDESFAGRELAEGDLVLLRRELAAVERGLARREVSAGGRGASGAGRG
jgi:transglutaminase-like putative cysteine protease